MTDTPQYLHERLLSEAEKTLAFFEQLPEDSWRQIIYTEGAAWTMRQVLAHFVATEDGIRRLVENILAGGEGSPEDFNLDAYNERKVTALDEATPAELMLQFNINRQKSARLVAEMSQADLAKTGRHPFLGIASLADILKLLYRHNQIHLREIRKALP